MSRTVIIDVCGTLFQSNTTFDFIDFLYQEKKIFPIRYKMLKFFFVKYFLGVVGKIISYDLYRRFYISLLTGYSFSELEYYVNKFYDDHLSKVFYTQILDIINEEKLKQSNIILCSASLDIIVRVIAKKMNLEYYSTRLSFSHGICTGRLNEDYFGKKEIFLTSILNGKNINKVVTDNVSDLNLVKLSEESYILSKKRNINFWKKNGIVIDHIIEKK